MTTQKTIQGVDRESALPVTPDEAAELLQAQAKTAISLEEAQSYGIQLPDVVLNLAEWLTIKHYANQYGVTTQLVSQWITRGVIPPDCTITIPELNNIRLVKNQSYRQP